MLTSNLYRCISKGASPTFQLLAWQISMIKQCPIWFPFLRRNSRFDQSGTLDEFLFSCPVFHALYTGIFYEFHLRTLSGNPLAPVICRKKHFKASGIQKISIQQVIASVPVLLKPP